MQSKITTLANGLRVITSSNPQLETVSLGIWVKTGSAYEHPEVNGISHFLEHMSFKGTKTRSALDISEAIEDVGGQSNAYTSREFTAYYAKMLKDDAELALDVLADSLINSTFPEEELKKMPAEKLTPAYLQKRLSQAMGFEVDINQFENPTDISGLFQQINTSRGLVWATPNHSSLPILSVAYGQEADEFTGVYHNTDILPRMKNVLGGKEE